MGTRAFIIGLSVIAMTASSCASTARDALVEAYDDETTADDHDEADLDGTPAPSRSIGQKAVDVIDDAGSAGCVTDLRQVQVAVETHFALNGFDATTMDDLVPFGVEDEMNRWMLQIPIGATAPEVIPIAGGPCDI